MSTTTDNVFKSEGGGEREEEDKNYDSSLQIETLDDVDIDDNIKRGVYAYGFEKLSPIQRKAIKPLSLGQDVIGQAQSGTGKTAAFSIGLLARLDLKENCTQAIVLSPTRELAGQTGKVITALGSCMDGLRVLTSYGGLATDDGFSNSSFLKRLNPHVVCGCAGRVYDMLKRHTISGDKVKLIVLDEADEMLSSGFKEQVYDIFQYFDKSSIQVALFSATLPEEIQLITNQIMRNPALITVKAEKLTLDGISQYFIAVEDDRQKYLTLKDLYANISVTQCIIYCNSVKRVTDLYEAMMEDGFPVCCIHSGMEKSDRDKSFGSFKSGGTRVLISSNVTSRGIDVQQVSTVINFDIPKCVHTYLHRIGRSGRWGRKGVAINFITRRDVPKIKEYEEHYKCQIEECPVNLSFLQKFS
jgi:superfamily II DNA/RNA helicase